VATRGEKVPLLGGKVMADLTYLGLTVVFFWLTWLLVKLCERL